MSDDTQPSVRIGQERMRFLCDIPADAKVGQWAGELYIASPSLGLFRLEGDRLVPVPGPSSHDDPLPDPRPDCAISRLLAQANALIEDMEWAPEQLPTGSVSSGHTAP